MWFLLNFLLLVAVAKAALALPAHYVSRAATTTSSPVFVVSSILDIVVLLGLDSDS